MWQYGLQFLLGFIVAGGTYLFIKGRIKSTPGGSVGAGLSSALLGGTNILAGMLLGLLGWILFLVCLEIYNMVLRDATKK